MQHSLSAAGASDVGRVRSRNEDAFTVQPRLGLIAVADGMGGHPAGDIASSLAVEELAALFEAGEESVTVDLLPLIMVVAR